MFLSAPIPDFRLSHCPYIKDKQLQACPRQMILLPNTTAHLPMPAIYAKIVRPWMEYTLLYIFKEEDSRRQISYNQPTRTSLLHHRCYVESNLRDLKSQTGNVSKTSFRDWSYKWPKVPIHRCYCSCPPSRGQVSGANLNNYFKLTNIFKEKLHLKAKKIDER